MMYSLQELQSLLGFTPDDIEQNRIGELSESQQESLQDELSARSGCLLGIGIIMMIGGAVSFLFLPPILGISAIIISVILIVLAFFNRSSDSEVYYVQHVTGEMIISKEAVRGADEGEIFQHYITINNKRLRSNQQLHQAFRNDEGIYTVYYIAQTPDDLDESISPYPLTMEPASDSRVAAYKRKRDA